MGYQKWRIGSQFGCVMAGLWFSLHASAQNYERYRPLDASSILRDLPDLPTDPDLPPVPADDRILVPSLDAIVIVDDGAKIDTSDAIDQMQGLQYDFESSRSIVYQDGVRNICQACIGQPITLRKINQIAADINKHYRRCKQPIVDVLIPEQRITTGTLHLVVVESRIGKVKLQPGCYFDFASTSKWIESTRPGDRIYEYKLEDDLFWLNQNPFRRVSVDFEKGDLPGTTDVVYKTKDLFPLRGYVGVDDSGVETLNYGRFFAGMQYGNFLGRGGILGYQYTADEEFRLLEAHSLSLFQPLNRDYSAQVFGSWAGVRPMLDAGLSQDGESYQFGATLLRHLIRNRNQQRNLTAGIDFKSTDNNLEFDGTRISDSNADLFQLRFGWDDYVRDDLYNYRLLKLETFIGPGGGMTGANSAAAFATIRPDTRPDYIYGRARYEENLLIQDRVLLAARLTGQATSNRLLFSETLGLGGFDTIRGTDQRAFSADHGWIANFELGPKPLRWGTKLQPSLLRSYGFIDLGNGYIDDPRPGEDACTFGCSTGVGLRYQLSDRIIARADYGVEIEEIDAGSRSSRGHFGITWIPGPRL